MLYSYGDLVAEALTHDQFEITLQTNGQVGGLEVWFQGLENKLDVNPSSVRSGTRRLSEGRGNKGKSSRRAKPRSLRGMHAKIVGLSDAKVARKRGNVEVRIAFRDFVLRLTRLIDRKNDSRISSVRKPLS